MEFGNLLEYGIFLAIIIALITCFYVIQQIGKGILNVIFISFGVGIFLIGLSRLFLFLSDRGIYQLADADVHIWWHLIFYFGIFSFIWGGLRLKSLSQSANPSGFNQKDLMLLSVLSIIALMVFVIAIPLEHSLSGILVGSFIDTFGLHHFIAFILAFIAGWYMFYVKKNWGQLLAPSVTPFLIFLILMGVQHLWELLTESWKVIVVTSEFGEIVEKFIVGPALIFLIIGLYKVANFIHSQTSAKINTPVSTS